MQLTLQLVSIATSALFLSLLPIRLLKLRGEPLKVVSERRGLTKLRIALVLSVIQLGIVVTVAFSPSENGHEIRLYSSIASFVACGGLGPLLFFEHNRSVKPSDLGIVYLLLSLAFDLASGLTKYEDTTFAFVMLRIANLCVKTVLLVIECRQKRTIPRVPHGQWSPEELANILDRTFFWWINSLLVQGNRHVLTGENLPPIDQKLSSRPLRQRALQAWDQRAKPEGRTTLPKVLVLSILPYFLAPIIPRLFLILFRYAQPVLISTAIRFLSGSSAQSADMGHLVIFMAVVIYVGLAMSRAVYFHLLNRLKIMIRGTVVGLINNKSFQQLTDHDDGRVVTLMSTDAESVGQAASMFHETWAQVIEVLLGTTMLAREVGWVCLVPYIIIFFCSRMSRYLAKNLQGKQKNWTMATQKRLAMTTSMLASMKSLKMLGVSPYTESLIQSLRHQELNTAKKVRWMMVAYNASANALGIFSPIITFVLFVLVASFNTETAFTTTALLGLVTHPANMIMSIVPQAVGALAAFERIQEYLLQPPRHDQRVLLPLKKTKDSLVTALTAISIEDVTIQPPSIMSPILTNINLTINQGSIVICSGPVGSGKTVLLKSLMGELPIITGSISICSKRIGYCEQSPWLPSGTLEQAVCGFSPKEQSWYEQVIRLCCLDEDLLALPKGDNTVIGSRGLNLSGGQRQRVALARAVYARCEIVFLDDSFSALDGGTESRIAENLFGPEGFFRKMGTTVFLVTNSATHFHLADCLVLLENNTVVYEGTWAGLAQDQKHVLKFKINEKKKDGNEEQPQIDKTVLSKSLKVDEAAADLDRATGDMSLYGYYLKAVGYRNLLLLLICTASYSFFITFPQYWLQQWTEAPVSRTRFYIGGYLILSLLAWAATNGSMWSTHILIAPQSGAELHRRLLSTIIGAPLSYFSTTDNGVTLNRFSQDIQLVDKSLPPAILSILNQAFKLLVQVVLLLSAQKIMATTLPLCMITVYFIQRIYLRTSRQLRLLDLESQSAVYSSFLESVEGVVTIRAFCWERKAIAANIECLDKSQQPAYILFCLQQWLGVVLDLIIAAIVTGLITLAIILKGTTAGQIGMALNIVIVANSTLFGLVTSWTNIEISLGAISRLKTLEADTPKEEKPYEDYVPEETWPSSGRVEFDRVTVAYNSDTIALQDVTMEISAGQQLVICGRTGSGKSTLMLTLLRLLDVQSGTIKIDGVDLSLVPRNLIRQRCFITVSQDPFVLGPASLRFNLDPSGFLSDRAVVAALERTYLWSHFEAGDSPPRKAAKILDSSVSSLPQMSTGQSQLFALARAILRLQSLQGTHGHIMPILLLDEATSSLDTKTEIAIRSIIHEEFIEKGHTVIGITHRLSGITESVQSGRDVVALLSQGRIERFGGVEDILGVNDLKK